MTVARSIALTLRHQAGVDRLPQAYLYLLDRLLEELDLKRAESEKVHVIDGADWPAPDSGFAKLGGM